MIDMSDYYLLIVAGKYGSIDPEENISYTEKEYRYAVNKGMPILAFLHQNIELLPVFKVGATDEERDSVKRFREDVKKAVSGNTKHYIRESGADKDAVGIHFF